MTCREGEGEEKRDGSRRDEQKKGGYGRRYTDVCGIQIIRTFEKQVKKNVEF